MTVKKQFAQDGTALDDCMDQLIEVLAQLLDEPETLPTGPDNQAAAQSAPDLRSGDDRGIHVVVNKPKN